MPGERPVDQSATYCVPPSRVAHAPIYKRVPMTTLCATTTFPPPIHLNSRINNTSVIAQITPIMTNLTYDSASTVDTRGALEYPEEMWVDDAERMFSATTLPHALDVSDTPSFMILGMQLIERCDDVGPPSCSNMVLPQQVLVWW